MKTDFIKTAILLCVAFFVFTCNDEVETLPQDMPAITAQPDDRIES